MPPSPRARVAGLAIAAVLTAVLAACGSSQPSATSTTVASPDDAMAAVRARSPLFDGLDRRDPDLVGQGSWWDAEAVDGGWRVTVEVGWGDCEAGCIDRHRWAWTVDTAARTAFEGETGPPLPDPVLAGLEAASRAQGLGGWAVAGPTCPVAQPDDPACGRRMVGNATLVVSNAAGVEVARFTTDGSGLLRVPLAPGEYGVDAQPVEGLLGTPGPATVTVAEGAETWLDLAYDTGIR